MGTSQFKQLRQETKTGFFKIANSFLVCLILITGVYYLASINDLSVKSFKLRDLRAESEELVRTNREIEAKMMNLESYGGLSARLESLKMVSVGEVEYLVVKNNIVAKK
jgi:cell division protein FtsB